MTSRAIKLSVLTTIGGALAVGILAFQAQGRDVRPPGSQAGGLREIDGFNIKNPDYVGRFGDPGRREGRLQIKITKRSKSGEPLEGLFQPKEVTLDCFGGPPDERRYTLSPYVIYFHDRGRRFEGQDYGIDQFGYQSVLLFRGAIANDGARAEGTITILDNPTRAANQPYCFLGGRYPWSAGRL